MADSDSSSHPFPILLILHLFSLLFGGEIILFLRRDHSALSFPISSSCIHELIFNTLLFSEPSIFQLLHRGFQAIHDGIKGLRTLPLPPLAPIEIANYHASQSGIEDNISKTEFK